MNPSCPTENSTFTGGDAREKALELFIKYGGKHHRRIESEMRALGFPTFLIRRVALRSADLVRTAAGMRRVTWSTAEFGSQNLSESPQVCGGSHSGMQDPVLSVPPALAGGFFIIKRKNIDPEQKPMLAYSTKTDRPIKPMKKNAFILLAVFLFSVCVSLAQNPAPTPDLPKKPEKDPETANEFYEAARWVAWNDRDYDKAFEYFNNALALEPNHVNSYFQRGLLYADVGKCREAIADFDKVIELIPDSHNTLQQRGLCKLNLKEYGSALADMDMAVAILAADGRIQPLAFMNRGKVRYILGNYDGAIDDLTTAIRAYPNEFVIILRALTYLKKGDETSAIADLSGLSARYQGANRPTAEKYPDLSKEPEGYPHGEDPLAKLKEPETDGDGIKRFTVMAERPFSATSGSVSRQCKGCPEIKFAGFEDMLDIDNWFFPGEKKIDISTLFGRNGIVDHFLGVIHLRRGETGEAIASFTRTLNRPMAYRSGFTYFFRGHARMLKHEWEPAVRDFSWAISNSRIADAYLERGIAILMLGHDKLAQKDFDKYLELHPDRREEMTARIEEAKKLREELKNSGSADKKPAAN